MKGDKAAAQECFERSVFVTSEMAYEVLRVSIISVSFVLFKSFNYTSDYYGQT